MIKIGVVLIPSANSVLWLPLVPLCGVALRRLQVRRVAGTVGPRSLRRHGEANIQARRYDAEALHDARVAADLRRDILFSRVLLSSSQFHK